MAMQQLEHGENMSESVQENVWAVSCYVLLTALQTCARPTCGTSMGA